MMYVLIFFTHCTGMLGFKNFDITRTISITDVTQSTCLVNFETINDQPTTSITIPINMITTNATLTTPTNMITVNDTFGSSTDSVPLAAIIPSIVGGIVGLCVIFICILGFIIRMKYRKRQKNDASTLQSVISRYVYMYRVYHRRRNRGGHGGHGPHRFQKMNFGPHSFGEVRGIVFNDLYGWKMQKYMQNHCY